MKKYWVLAVLAAFSVGIFCGAMLLGRPGAGDQPGQGSVQPSPAAPVSPPEGEVLQLGQGEEDWKYWGFQWQDHAFCYAEPLDWGAYQYPAAAGMPNQEDSPEWGVILYTPDQQGWIQIWGAVRSPALTVPGQQKLFQLSREGERVGQAMFGGEEGQVSLIASFDQSGGTALSAFVQMPEAQWRQYQDQVLDILGEIYPADPGQAQSRP